MRYSRQREALYELLCSTTTHPDAEWLYMKLKENYPNISLGTVYRNLKQMAQNGDILELNCGNASHYDGDLSEHYHLSCTGCGKIYDIPRDYVSVTVRDVKGFGINGFNLMLQGLCKDCIK